MESNQTSSPTVGEGETQKLNLNNPCKISGVNFEGVHKTSPRILGKMVSDIFNSTTILDFLQRSTQIRENMRALNAFESIELVLNQVDPNDTEKYEVTVLIKERGRITASAQTAVDDHSTHLNIQLALPNVNGIGDTIQVNSKFNKKLYSGECRYSIPLMPWRRLWSPCYTLSYSQYKWDSMPSGFDQEDRSINNQVDFYSLPQLKHAISFENIWRYIKSSSSTTPIEIREQSGHSIKSSFKQTTSWDNRLGGNFPFEGILAKLSNEFTMNLVSGGAKFTRHELDLQFNAMILPKYDVLCQVNLLAGTLLRAQKTNICDRFFAGGPLTLRGFKFQGLEPVVNNHPLGSSSYLSAGLHIYSILPYTTPESQINDYIRPHLFFNTGTLGELPDFRRFIASKDDVRREMMRFKDSLRYSCGFGLVMYFMRLRLEINYCLPLVFREHDLNVKGMQWGFGLSYT